MSKHYKRKVVNVPEAKRDYTKYNMFCAACNKFSQHAWRRVGEWEYFRCPCGNEQGYKVA